MNLLVLLKNYLVATDVCYLIDMLTYIDGDE